MARPAPRPQGLARPARRVLVALAGLVLAGGVARADGLSLRVDPTFGFSHQTQRDESGTESATDGWLLGQRYRLGLSLAPYPALRLSSGLVFEDNRAWSSTDDQPQTSQVAQRWTGFAQANVGSPLLGGALAYSRQEQEARSPGQPATGAVRESVEARAGWRPADLPSVALGAQHAHNFSIPAGGADRYLDEVRLDTGFAPQRNVDLRYGVAVQRADDRVGDVVSVDQNHFARVSWSDTFLDNRLNASANYNAGLRFGRVTAGAGGASLTLAVLPTGGLSKTITFPDTQERVTLPPNGGLVDGVLATTAGVNIGFGRTAAGDTSRRAVGAQFAQVADQPAVSKLFVWVDQRLPPEVVADLGWQAWESADNLTWTPVPLAGAVVFGDLDSRFEITIRASTARYLRVDVAPLHLGVTTDQRYETISVTELQCWSVTPVAAGTTSSDRLSGSLSASARMLLLANPDLVYSVTTFLSHANRPLAGTWSVTNGLSIGHRLGPTVSTAGQLQRTDDGGSGRPRSASTRWGGSLSWDPLATFGANLNYNGLWSQVGDGDATSHALGAGARAELYRGLSASATSTGTVGRTETGRASRGLDLATGLNVVPNGSFTASGSWGYHLGEQSGAGQATVRDRTSHLDATAAFNPFPALSFSGAVSRNLTGRASTQGTFNAGFSPFGGGALQLRSGIALTVDTSSDTTTRIGSAGLRWSFRGGAYLDVGYSDTETRSPALVTRAQSVFASLSLTLL